MVVAPRARGLELGGVVAALWGAGLDAALVGATPPAGAGSRRSDGRRHLRRGGHRDVCCRLSGSAAFWLFAREAAIGVGGGVQRRARRIQARIAPRVLRMLASGRLS